MTRGESQRHIAGAPVTALDVVSAQVVDEAERIAAEAASAARVDELRRAFDAAVGEHCMRFGFDRNGGAIA